MEPLFHTSILGSHAILYPDRLTYKQPGKKEQSIPLSQIASVTPAMMGMQQIILELRGGQKIPCMVRLKDKKKICEAIMKAKEEIKEEHTPVEAQVGCPKCGSTQITSQKKGWSLGTGFLGSNKVLITCLSCGHRFKPGAGIQVFRALIVLFFLALSTQTHAASACCSHHGGIDHCDLPSGHDMCVDGSLSPSCTCSAPVSSSPVKRVISAQSSPSVSSPKLLSSIFTPDAQTKIAGCRANGALPDHACTPGAVLPVTLAQLCKPGYTKTVRDVSEATKKKVFGAYSITAHPTGTYEVDHLIPLELGGSNEIANLWPEAATPTPGFHEKDKLENSLHQQVCKGTMLLSDAQRGISTDWMNAYSNMK